MSNTQKQEQQTTVTEGYRLDIYNSKKEELNKELLKYERYCIKSRDLEHLLRLHNFMLRQSMKQITALFNEFINNTSKDALPEEKEILQKTFDLLFKEHALDFYNQFFIRCTVEVNEQHFETKEVYRIRDISVIYKDQKEDFAIASGDVFHPLINEIYNDNIPYTKLSETIVKSETLLNILSETFYQTLINPNSIYNTIYFNQKADKITYLNASDFDTLVKSSQFKSYVSKFNEVSIETVLIPAN